MVYFPDHGLASMKIADRLREAREDRLARALFAQPQPDYVFARPVIELEVVRRHRRPPVGSEAWLETVSAESEATPAFRECTGRHGLPMLPEEIA